MKKLPALVVTLIALVTFAGPAVAQQQSWSVAIEQNPMLTNCGTTTDIPVAGASSCATAITAAQNLLSTLLATPNCMGPSCPVGYTMTPGVPSCTEDHYTFPNGSPAIRYQVNLNWNCVPPRVICATPPPATNYNTGSTSANNVPLNQCYKNDVGECLYNFAAPGTVGGWNTGCPAAVAGSDCCGWTPLPATSCQDDLTSGTLTITGPTASNITANSADLSGSVNVAPIPPGCTYQAKLVWALAPTPPFPNLADGPKTIPPGNSISLNGPASPLNPSSGYGARIEVTKACVGLASECNGQTNYFETPKGEEKCDLVIGKSPSKGSIPLISGQQATFEIVVTNQGTGTCLAPISVADNFTQGLTYLSGGTSGWVCPPGPILGAGSVTCTNSTPLAPNQSSLLLVTFDVTAAPPTAVGDCATVGVANDTNPANNRACIELPVGKPKLPDLKIKKHMTCPGPTTPQGTKCTITFTINNSGPGTFNGILVLSDVLTPTPSNLSWAGGSTPTSSPQGWGWSCGIGLSTYDIGCATTSPVTLVPSGSTTFSIDVYILPAGQYKNCANVKGHSQFPYTPNTLIQEVTLKNNKSCVPIQVGPPCNDVAVDLSTGQNPNWSVSPGTVGITSALNNWIQPVSPVSWIQPASASSPQNLPGGNYTYNIPFTLPAPLSQYSSISLTVNKYAADNGVPAVSMNGGLSVASCAGPNCFSAWQPSFSIQSMPSFQPGNNLLEVTVYNNPTSGQGPTYTGLVVDATLRAVCKK